MGRNIEETVYYTDGAKDVPLENFMAAIKEAIGTIPPELMASATVKMRASFYDDNAADLIFQIIYERPETDAEIAKRVQDEANASANHMAALEAKYSRLKADLDALHLRLGK